MTKTYTLVWDTTVEKLTLAELFQRMKEVDKMGYHIQSAVEFGLFDFMVCFWKP